MHTPQFKVRLGLLAAALAFSGPLVPAALHAAPSSAVSTPAPGSRERAELMDALRGPFAQVHHETVTFKVDRLKVGGGYAYMDAVALGSNGKPPRDLAAMGGTVSAFYQKKNGHWTVVKWGSYGGTDLVDYARKHYPNAPRALYPGSGSDISTATHSTTNYYTPKPGSRERDDLMDALRGPFTVKYHNMPVFEVKYLKVGGGYAYMEAIALDSNGKPAVGHTRADADVTAFYRKQNGFWVVQKWSRHGGPIVKGYGLKHYPGTPSDLYP